MPLELKKIFLNENEELSVHTDLDMTDCDLGENRFPDVIGADIRVSSHAGLVEFDAAVSFTFSFRCDRCYERFDRDFAFRFHHILVTSLPELPSKLLCKDSCKGLCPKCGKNLNNGSCACSKGEPDPRLAALSQLLSE